MSKLLLRGYEVNYIERNPRGAKLIVLLHGFGASTYSWLSVIDELAKYGHVVAYDRTGFGFTDRPMTWNGTNPYSFSGQIQLLDAALTHFGENREIVLVGHSAGGQLAAQYVVDHPGKISALILESPAIFTPGPPDFLSVLLRAKFLQERGPKWVGGFAKIGNKILFDSFWDKSKLTEEIIRGYERPMDNPDWREGFWEFLKASKTSDVRKRLGEIDIPTFVITGQYDQIVKVEDTMKVAERIAGHRIYLVPDAGHLAHEEQPSDYMRVVGNWLTRPGGMSVGQERP
jgi:pimeloyl-ACP methyl ester carboxylesterase